MGFLELAGLRDKDHQYGPPAGFAYRFWQQAAGDRFVEKYAAAGGKPFNFLINAGVGAGKTIAAAGIAAYALNVGLAQRVVYICPNVGVIDSVRSTFKRWRIDLVDWENGKYPYGEPVSADGLVMTYGSLNSKPHVQAALCRKPTILLLDELHHLADMKAWGGAARDAFENKVKAVVSFTGTPWRTDNESIPFVEYMPESGGIRLYKADYTYPLGQAIAAKLCRTPHFILHDASVEIPDGKDKRVVTFKDKLNKRQSALRLAGAVRPNQPARTEIIEKFLGEFERLGKGKATIFVGGDTTQAASGGHTGRTSSSGHRDATVNLPAELIRLGVPADQIVSVTSVDPKARSKIREFGESDARFLISIDMLSEGVDIPELQAALFLSTVTANLKTIQRIGRVLRGEGMALIAMFADPHYVQIASDIMKEKEYYEQIVLAQASATEYATSERGAGAAKVVIPTGISSWPSLVVNNGFSHDFELFERVRGRLESRGLPSSFDRVANVIEMADHGLLSLEAFLQ